MILYNPFYRKLTLILFNVIVYIYMYIYIYILEHQNNKQKLQIHEALRIRNMQPPLNRNNFQTSANVLKCF